MKNEYAISSLARQLCKVSEKVDSLAMGIQENERSFPEVSEMYQDLLMDEIEHVQILTLELTKLVTEMTADTANTDESGGGAFAEGELQSKLGAKAKGVAEEEIK